MQFIFTLHLESGMTDLIEVSTLNFDIFPRWYVNGMWGTSIVAFLVQRDGELVS